MATPSDVEKEKVKNPPKIGEKFGYWTILSSELRRDHKNNVICVCRCVCGKEKEVRIVEINRGRSRSCLNCSRVSNPIKFAEIRNKYNLPENLKDMPPYITWRKIKERCENPNTKAYPSYGGRGIKICDEWSDCLNFIDWAYFNGYKEGLTIERLNVNKGYEPSNCSWIPLGEQARNKRRYSNNKSGVNGIYGSESRWSCIWYDENGKMRTKSFSKNKYGESKARFLAEQFRAEKISELELLGISYGEFHGL